jgi:hypothetical protein
MSKTDKLEESERCESPVYVNKSPISSPVFVSKSQDDPSSYPIHKLILPHLDTSTISVSNVETDENAKKLLENSAPSSSQPLTSSSLTEPLTKSVPEVGTNPTSTEMVTVVVTVAKDFNYCKEEFIKQVKENNVAISSESVMRLLRIAMVIVEQTKETGEKKKEFAIQLLKELFLNDKTIVADTKLEVLNLLTNGVVSDSIDIIVDASKGKFEVNKIEKVVEEVAKSCFTICLEKLFKKKQ